MTDDMAVGMPARGWSAIGGRMIPPTSALADRAKAAGAPRRTTERMGRVSFATSDGLLGPGRRLRYRRANWARFAALWLAVVLLLPLAAGWAWGLLGTAAR